MSEKEKEPGVTEEEKDSPAETRAGDDPAPGDDQADPPGPSGKGNESPGPVTPGDFVAPAAVALKKLSPLEIVSLGAIGLLLVGAVIAFGSVVMSHVGEEDSDKPASSLGGPVRGRLIGIASAEVLWREPRPGEKVKAGQDLVPRVRVRLTGNSGGGTSYLKTVFRDAEGRIRGDVTPLRIDGDNFADTGTPEIEIVGTEGFQERIRFIGYSSGSDFWTVELLEGPSYSGKDWTRLAYFTTGAKLEKTGGNPN